MSKEHEKITVKEFAKRQGITEQAVYKSKKLKKYRVKLNNITYIDLSAFEADNKPAVANYSTNEQPTVANEQPTVESAVSSDFSAVLAILQEQLKEKDKQIERLQEQLAEQAKTAGEEKEQLLTLLSREQESNRNNQVLIAKAQEKIALPPESKKKRFFNWFSSTEETGENNE